eukprot:4059835-Prymnesium_polylepis.2
MRAKPQTKTCQSNEADSQKALRRQRRGRLHGAGQGPGTTTEFEARFGAYRWPSWPPGRR